MKYQIEEIKLKKFCSFEFYHCGVIFPNLMMAFCFASLKCNLFFWFILQVSQFHTDLSLLNMDGKEVMRKTISVNDPLRYGGVTIYQTDWSISALQILKDNKGPYNLAMAPLKINGDKKLYGTFLPVGDINSPDVKGM